MSDDVNKPVKCNVFRCTKKPEMYLYVRADLTEADVPPELVKLTGRLELAMELELTPERKLAREDVTKVMANLIDKGLHLQMPPDPIIPTMYHGNED